MVTEIGQIGKENWGQINWNPKKVENFNIKKQYAENYSFSIGTHFIQDKYFYMLQQIYQTFLLLNIVIVRILSYFITINIEIWLLGFKHSIPGLWSRPTSEETLTAVSEKKTSPIPAPASGDKVTQTNKIPYFTNVKFNVKYFKHLGNTRLYFQTFE